MSPSALMVLPSPAGLPGSGLPGAGVPRLALARQPSVPLVPPLPAGAAAGGASADSGLPPVSLALYSGIPGLPSVPSLPGLPGVGRGAGATPPPAGALLPALPPGLPSSGGGGGLLPPISFPRPLTTPTLLGLGLGLGQSSGAGGAAGSAGGGGAPLLLEVARPGSGLGGLGSGLPALTATDSFAPLLPDALARSV